MFWNKSENNQLGEFISTIRDFKLNSENLDTLLIPEEKFNGELRELAKVINKRLKHSIELMHDETHKLEMVNNLIHSGLWTMYFDNCGEISNVIWSDAFRRMIGFNNTSDFPNTLNAWIDKLHPEDKDGTLQAFGATIADKSNRTKYDVDYRLKTKSGEYRWYRAAGELRRLSNGMPDIFLGIFVDITDNKEKELQLKLQSDRHEAIDSTLSEGSWSMHVIGKDATNPSNNFWWSQQFRRLLGYNDESDFPNKLDSWSDKLHPEDKKKVLDTFSRHVNDFSGRTPFNLEYRLKHKDGTYRWFKAVGKTVRESNGTPIIVAGSILDITDVKLNRQKFETEMGGNLKMLITSISNISVTISQMTNSMQSVAEQQNDIADSSKELQEAVEKTLEIISIIQNIASQTNLLSLNASIEAARAGEAGRGFAVVADEVRKLANETGSTSEKISTGLRAMNDTVNSVIDKIVVINQNMSEESANMQEINATIEELDSLAKKINDIANNLFK